MSEKDPGRAFLRHNPPRGIHAAPLIKAVNRIGQLLDHEERRDRGYITRIARQAISVGTAAMGRKRIVLTAQDR